MKRKSFDLILSSGGAMLTIVLLAAGALGLWGYSYANTNVHNQLAMQQIYVPPAGNSELADPRVGPYLNQYAGQEVLTGRQAEAYADHFIAVHMSDMPFGGVYAKASDAARALPAGSAEAAKANAIVQTIFRGTTLRGLLLEAYAFWTIGQVALVGAIVSFVLAGFMFILTVFGFVHFRRVSEELEFPRSLEAPERVPVSV